LAWMLEPTHVLFAYGSCILRPSQDSFRIILASVYNHGRNVCHHFRVGLVLADLDLKSRRKVQTLLVSPASRPEFNPPLRAALKQDTTFQPTGRQTDRQTDTQWTGWAGNAGSAGTHHGHIRSQNNSENDPNRSQNAHPDGEYLTHDLFALDSEYNSCIIRIGEVHPEVVSKHFTNYLGIGI
jgi:hypothetical protein